ncbi:MAG: cobalamin biosynthesis protein [Pseudomonadota bacterium]
MIVAGFGFRRAATVSSLEGALAAAWGARAIDCLAVPAEKAEADPIKALAASRSQPLVPVDAEDLVAVATVTPGPAAAPRFNGSPAEAVALAAAGPGARLAGPRAVSPDRLATCAIAIREPAS